MACSSQQLENYLAFLVELYLSSFKSKKSQQIVLVKRILGEGRLIFNWVIEQLVFGFSTPTFQLTCVGLYFSVAN